MGRGDPNRIPQDFKPRVWWVNSPGTVGRAGVQTSLSFFHTVFFQSLAAEAGYLNLNISNLRSRVFAPFAIFLAKF